MEQENPSDTDASVEGDDGRGQSTIQFPYADLETGIELVRTLHGREGAIWCSPDQLAAAMGQTPKSGNFRLKVSTARIFGLIKTSPGKIEITDLGFEVLDPAREKAAKVQSFLSVELFKKVYEDFKGRQLPPRPAAFELMLERAGVAPKQKANARRTLDNSATQAGFYEHGKERLVAPNVEGGTARRESDREDMFERSGNGGGTGGGTGGGGGRTDDPQLHPFIQGLLRTLPAPETNWTVEGRAKWLQAAANIFDLMYKGSGEITVSSKPGSPPDMGATKDD